jgi:hypothetical protein
LNRSYMNSMLCPVDRLLNRHCVLGPQVSAKNRRAPRTACSQGIVNSRVVEAPWPRARISPLSMADRRMVSRPEPLKSHGIRPSSSMTSSGSPRSAALPGRWIQAA